ncbi:MAG: hypothetical protein CM15mP77_0060 [Synechococcus sp.]|nr:MAG: hypothetical protein CM15mP77_0060 [Synechococcus sp.]
MPRTCPIANICEAMGHTIEVHLKSYARFSPMQRRTSLRL